MWGMAISSWFWFHSLTQNLTRARAEVVSLGPPLLQRLALVRMARLVQQHRVLRWWQGWQGIQRRPLGAWFSFLGRTCVGREPTATVAHHGGAPPLDHAGTKAAVCWPGTRTTSDMCDLTTGIQQDISEWPYWQLPPARTFMGVCVSGHTKSSGVSHSTWCTRTTSIIMRR